MDRLNNRLKSVARKVLRRAPPGSTLPIDARAQAASDLIRTRLEASAPCMVARMGRVELEAVLRCLDPAPLGVRPEDGNILLAMRRNAGFFPPDEPHLRGFAERYLQDLPLIDILGAWLPGEAALRNHFPSARIVPLPDLEPYYHSNPWSRALDGRKVLVVHPFTGSIQRQYARRAELFADPRILPEFELHTLPAVQSIAGNNAGYTSWFAALEEMRSGMEAIDFDIAIIGAGAYGLPLAAHAKRLGRKAVHLGGATQILFGIQGRRWDNHPYISRLYNPAWARPLPEETPPNYTTIEGGCYW